MTVLVTGATGLLGSHVTDLLVGAGERPRVLVRPGEALNGLADAHVDVARGDLQDRASLQAAVRGVDRVLHCAARTGPWGPDTEYRRTNVSGLRDLVDVALAAGVRRFVHVSSVTVHGVDVDGGADETAPLHAEPNPYCASKVAGERLLAGMIRSHAAPVTIVRPGWIYGPRDAASFGRFAAMIQRRQMMMIGSGGNHVPLIYVRDAALGVVLAGDSDQAVGNAYILVNDEPVTQRDYLNAIAAELGVPAPSRRIPYRLAIAMAAVAESAARVTRRRQPPPVTRFGVQLLGGENRYNIGRARRDLGFSPQVGVAEGVRRGVEWYRAAYRGAVALREPA
jgi:nucleoside-diphosphate-sugar epimerase